MGLFRKFDLTVDKFDQTIRDYLEKALNAVGVEYNDSSIYSIIFKGIKGVVQNLMFYMEDVLNEQNVYKASRRQSIYSLSKLSGYEPYYGSPAIGTIVARLKINNGINNKTTRVIMENETRIKNTNTNIVYTIKLNTSKYVFDVTQPLFTHEFNITQGFYTRASHIATGQIFETVHVYSLELFDINTVEVSVNGEKWNRVGNLYDMGEDSNDYMVKIGYDNSFDIIFGNGVYGKILTRGQVVSIKYIKHIGTSGNIDLSDVYKFKFVDNGYDMYGNNIDLNNFINLDINHLVSGGVNADKISFVRNNIGTNSRSNVIVSNDNFDLFLKRFSFMGYHHCYIETNTLNINCIALRKNKLNEPIKYLDLDENKDLFIKPQEQEMIINTLMNSNKIFAGITFKFENPVIRKFAIICYVKNDNVYEQKLIKSEIQKHLCIYFYEKIVNTQFISKSDIINYLHNNIQEIKSISIDIISALNEECWHKGYYQKYVQNNINNTIDYSTKTVLWDDSVHPGLDQFGNIYLDSSKEIPLLHGGFDYYTDKTLHNDNHIYISNEDAIQVYFV